MVQDCNTRTMLLKSWTMLLKSYQDFNNMVHMVLVDQDYNNMVLVDQEIGDLVRVH